MLEINFLHWFAGHEHQSYRHCNKTHIGGLESGCSLPNMGLCNGRNLMHNCSVELFKQGNKYFYFVQIFWEKYGVDEC